MDMHGVCYSCVLVSRQSSTRIDHADTEPRLAVFSDTEVSEKLGSGPAGFPDRLRQRQACWDSPMAQAQPLKKVVSFFPAFLAG